VKPVRAHRRAGAHFLTAGTAIWPGLACAQAPEPIANTLLPHDLSPWSMFLQADTVVKAVMIGLAFASIVTWTVLMAKSLELARAMRRQRQVLAIASEARSLEQAAGQVGAAASALIEAAREEVKASADALDDREGLKERIASRLERIEANIGRRMTQGTGALATIGATAPFVGLFGTVWGIMNSFIGISKAQTTNLAVVAPGIAEALLATACGLVAAIPAVVIYNHFARQIAGYKALVADTSAAVLRLVSRDLSRGVAGEPEKPVRALSRAAE
jgi:biopolymer transport protein ExbB